MKYKVANILGIKYDNNLNKYIVDVVLAREGKGKVTKLFYAFKEDAYSLKIGDIVDGIEEGESRKDGK